MKNINVFVLAMLIFALAGNTFAHGDKHAVIKEPAASTVSAPGGDSAMQKAMEEHAQMKSIDAFPNYHPLIVHFPIVLLLVAVVFQLFSFFVYKKELSILTLILLALGVITAWFASNIFHAHPAELTGKASAIFETHELMASLTWWFSLAALAIKIPSHFFFKQKWWVESTVAIFLIASGVTVSIAGHHGSMLVHMEGIGPMGKYLESDNMPEMTTGKPSAAVPMEMPEPAKENVPAAIQEENHHIGELGKGPHGGTIQEAEPYHIEIIADGGDLIFYLLDGDAKPISIKNVTGSVKMHYADKSVKTIELMEMGGKLTAMQANDKRSFTAACTLTKAGKSYSASFNSAKDLPANTNSSKK